ncbi:MAG: GTP-binding protein, partial [Pseudomonadota bacterium]
LHVLTGPLGAGKTTLLNAALRDPAMGRAAIVVNEFGDVGIDQMLIDASSDDMIELTGGCVCCAVRGAFADGLTHLLMARSGEFNRVVVETSGLAEPGPLLAALHAHPFLSVRVRPSGVVCLVDATQGLAALSAQPEAKAQLTLADRVLLTKTDLQQAEAELIHAVREAAPSADIRDVSNSDFAPARALLDGTLNIGRSSTAGPAHGALRWAHGGREDDGAIAVSLTSDGPMTHHRLDLFLGQLTESFGPSLLRVKGLVSLSDAPDRPLLVQGVGSVIAPPERLEYWPAGVDTTCLVVIVRGRSATDIHRLWSGFTHGLAEDLPDAEALTANPLAVPGVRF